MSGTSVSLEVTVPFGSTATVYVPKSVEGTCLDPMSDDSYVVFEAGPGVHTFQSPR